MKKSKLKKQKHSIATFPLVINETDYSVRLFPCAKTGDFSKFAIIIKLNIPLTIPDEILTKFIKNSLDWEEFVKAEVKWLLRSCLKT